MQWLVYDNMQKKAIAQSIASCAISVIFWVIQPSDVWWIVFITQGCCFHGRLSIWRNILTTAHHAPAYVPAAVGIVFALPFSSPLIK